MFKRMPTEDMVTCLDDKIRLQALGNPEVIIACSLYTWVACSA